MATVVVRCARCNAPLGRGLPGATGYCRACRPPVVLPTPQAARAMKPRQWAALDRGLRESGALR